MCYHLISRDRSFILFVNVVTLHHCHVSSFYLSLYLALYLIFHVYTIIKKKKKVIENKRDLLSKKKKKKNKRNLI